MGPDQETHITEMPQESNQPPFVMLTQPDASEREEGKKKLKKKRIEEELQEREWRFWAMFEQADVGIAFGTLDGRLLRVNPRYCEIVGYPREELLERSFKDITYPDDVESNVEYLQRVLSGGTSARSMEKRYIRKDGSLVWANLTLSLMQGPSGEPREYMAVITDITERKRLEEKLSQVTQELATWASELEATFEAMANGVVAYDGEGRILQMNAAFRKLIGLQGQPGREGFEMRSARGLYTSLPVRERESLLAMRDEHGHPLREEQWPISRMLKGEVITEGNAINLGMRTLDGREVILNVSWTAVHDSEGRIVRGVIIYRDVTEHRQLERQVAERASLLEATFESMADGVIVFDGEGHLLEMNSAARELLGLEVVPDYSLQSVAGLMSPYAIRDEHGQFLTLEQWPLIRVLRGEVLKDATAVDVMIKARDGREVQLNVSGTPVYDQEGRIVRAVIVMRDVTERRQLERQTRDALEGLLKMAELLVKVPESPASPPDAIAEGFERRSASSAQAVRSVGQQLAELTCSILACQRVSITAIEAQTGELRSVGVVGISSELKHQWEARRPGFHLSELLANSPLQADLLSHDVLVLDMTQPPFRDWPNPYNIRKGLLVPMRVGEQIVGFLSLDYGNIDHEYTQEEIELTRAIARLAAFVLERERLLQEREQAHANELALREANRRMDEFLGIVSHELRSPLTTIKGNIQLAERRLKQVLAEGFERRSAEDNQLANDVGSATRASTASQSGKLQGVREAQAPTGDLADKSAVGGEGIDTRSASSAQAPTVWQDKLEVAQDLLERAERQIGVLNRMVGDLIDISRIQAGKLELQMEPKPCDLADIVQEVVQEQRKVHPERTILLEILAEGIDTCSTEDNQPANDAGSATRASTASQSGKLQGVREAQAVGGDNLGPYAPVIADADRIGQVVTNYLTNALKYSPAARPVEVRLEVEKQKVRVARVSVRDEGPGLPPEEQERVWQRFYRVPGVEAQNSSGVGLGLGLHISRIITERHQGEVGVQSEPGRGSIFWFTLPLAKDMEE
jgi:PAS domain S-box-containing protein